MAKKISPITDSIAADIDKAVESLEMAIDVANLSKKNNEWCIANSGDGDIECGNCGGLCASTEQQAKPLCLKCVHAFGLDPKPKDQWTHYKKLSGCDMIKQQHKGYADPTYLCKYCKRESHYEPRSSLTNWHQLGGMNCTCVLCGMGESGMTIVAAKTQKAKGMVALNDALALQNSNIHIPSHIIFDKKAVSELRRLVEDSDKIAINYTFIRLYNLASVNRQIIRQLSGLSDSATETYYPTLPLSPFGIIFVRPCPTRPRHGFVDSQPVVIWDTSEKAAKQAINEIVAIFDEAVKADSEAELLVLPMIPASMNIVLTPNLVSIGSGNDGATSGGDTLSLPLDNMKWDTLITKEVMARAGVSQWPFIEIVGTASKVKGKTELYAVQLRDGLPPEKARTRLDKNFIPHSVKVKQIITAKGTLIEWEKKMEELANTDGLVIWHRGGSLLSHYALHCRLHKIPLVTTQKPEIGQTLHPTKNVTDLAIPDKDVVMAGVQEGLSIGASGIGCSTCLDLMTYILHNSNVIDFTDPIFGRLLGVSLGAAVILAAAACCGELRHGDGEKTDHETGQVVRGEGGNRTTVYTKILSGPFNEVFFGNFARRWPIFGYTGWDGNSIGGIRWFECGRVTAELWNTICAYNNNSAAVGDLLEALNKVINISHNGAKLLTKFMHGRNPFALADTQPMILGVYAMLSSWNFLTNSVKHKDGANGSVRFDPIWAPSYRDFRTEVNRNRARRGLSLHYQCQHCRYVQKWHKDPADIPAQCSNCTTKFS